VATEGEESTDNRCEEVEAYEEQTQVSPPEEVASVPEFLLPDDALLKPVTRSEQPELVVVPAKNQAVPQQQQPVPDSNGTEAQPSDKAEAAQGEAVSCYLLCGCLEAQDGGGSVWVGESRRLRRRAHFQWGEVHGPSEHNQSLGIFR
jgi:hypothetical protein